jgi:hypothetical protein
MQQYTTSRSIFHCPRAGGHNAKGACFGSKGGQSGQVGCPHYSHAAHRIYSATNQAQAVTAAVVLQGALTLGHAFWLSANGVLLCEGPLPVQFVREVSAAELQRLCKAQEAEASLQPIGCVVLPAIGAPARHG